METARDLVGAAERLFADAGVDTPRLDAEVLLAHALGTTRPALIASFGDSVEPAGAVRFRAMAERRANREPVAYITGRKGFRNIDLLTDRRALIPRPETELLVEVVKAAAPRRLLEVATGGGAVALALADELPELTVLATDGSADALALAARNAQRLALADRVSFVCGDLLAALDAVEVEVDEGDAVEVEAAASAGAEDAGTDGYGASPGRTRSFDALAANLPYVATAEIAGLQPEITRYEPPQALDGGPDGLDLVRRLAHGTRERRVLRPGGLIALEIGDDQGSATVAILEAEGFTGARIHQDLSARDRVVSAREAPDR